MSPKEQFLREEVMELHNAARDLETYAKALRHLSTLVDADEEDTGALHHVKLMLNEAESCTFVLSATIDNIKALRKELEAEAETDAGSTLRGDLDRDTIGKAFKRMTDSVFDALDAAFTAATEEN